MVAAALISAGASLLGGILGRNSEKKAIAAQNEYNNPTNIRKRAEEAGFNPLSFIGPGVGLQTTTGGSNYMGSAIADAGMAFADAMSKKAELGKLDKLQQANAKLAAKVQTLTLRPKVAGIYAQRQSTPTIAAAVGGGNAEVSGGLSVTGSADVSGSAGSGDSGVNFRPLMTTSPVDPRREVDNAKISTTAGFMVVDNPYLPFPLYLPSTDGDEVVQWYDYPSYILPGLGSAALHYAGIKMPEVLARKAWNDAQPKRPSTDKLKPKPKASLYLNPRWNDARPMFGGGF